MLKNNSQVTLGTKTYRFCNQIGREPEILASFNRLAEETYGLHFAQVGGEYEPHVLLADGQVCANVSVNQVFFLAKGERKHCVQLGTVMTHRDYRGRGLSRLLMEQIVEEWKDRCDTLYLFANDSVLEFYPKFGFVPQGEAEFVYQSPGCEAAALRKLSMSCPADRALLEEKYREGNPFSQFSLVENQVLLHFYAQGVLREHLYWIEPYGVVAFAENTADGVCCYDIFGATQAPLPQILQGLRRQQGEPVVLGFTPADQAPFLCRPHREEDTTLFIHRCGENPFARDKGMFPLISHA